MQSCNFLVDAGFLYLNSQGVHEVIWIVFYPLICELVLQIVGEMGGNKPSILLHCQQVGIPVLTFNALILFVYVLSFMGEKVKKLGLTLNFSIRIISHFYYI